jgi:N-acetylglucosaminylphosphatidylinositol deacetylase
MEWYLPIQIATFIGTLWLFTAYMTRTFPIIGGKTICLVIAHPDDEAMFFSPTLRRLTAPELGNIVLILCFSTGDADGLGAIRRKELTESALQLGVREAQHVICLDQPEDFPDSMTATWDAERVAQTLRLYLSPPAVSGENGGSSSAPSAGRKKGDKTPNVDVLITFDQHGVSSHPNHISLYHGALGYVRGLRKARRQAGSVSPSSEMQLYTLTTTSAVRKYSSLLDAVATMTVMLWRRKERGEFPSPLLMVSGVEDYRKGQRAMTTAHKSQMRWFRWGWIAISRYMIINDLVKQKVA